jgi:hypothetical protein
MTPRSALLVGIAMLAVGCDDLCANEVVSDVSSPSGRNHAVVFMRDCGATTGFMIEVAVLPSSKKLPKQPGNTFSADDGHADVPLEVTAAWESDRALRLTHDPRLRIFRREPEVGEVKLTYATRP